MKRILLDKSPPAFETLKQVAMLAVIPAFILSLQIAWWFYDRTAGGADDRVGQRAAAFFLWLTIGITLLSVLIPAGVYIAMRRGVVIDIGKREVERWKGGFIIHFRARYASFEGASALRVEIREVDDFGTACRRPVLLAVMPGGETVFLADGLIYDEVDEIAAPIANALGLAVDWAVPEGKNNRRDLAPGEITELAGGDLLTISPQLLGELAKAEGDLPRKLDAERAVAEREAVGPARRGAVVGEAVDFGADRRTFGSSRASHGCDSSTPLARASAKRVRKARRHPGWSARSTRPGRGSPRSSQGVTSERSWSSRFSVSSGQAKA